MKDYATRDADGRESLPERLGQEPAPAIQREQHGDGQGNVERVRERTLCRKKKRQMQEHDCAERQVLDGFPMLALPLRKGQYD